MIYKRTLIRLHVILIVLLNKTTLELYYKRSFIVTK